MKPLNTIVLLLLLLGLGALIHWQLAKEDRGGVDVDLRLFEGVDVRQVTTMRIDNIERSLNLRLERDVQGEWYITDPIVYPATRSIVKLLLDDIAAAKVMVVPEVEWGEEELGFAPPKVVLEIDEKTTDGLETHRVEIGAKDIDGKRVHLRVDGRYLRALVRLYTTLNRDLHEFRSQRAMNLPPLEIVEVHRTGSVIHEIESEPVDYTTQAFLDGDTWRSTVPYGALLDPMDISVLVMGTAALKIDRFIEDDAVDLADYALDQPLIRIELVTRSGAREALLLSRRGNSGRWYVKRESAPHVWMIEPEKAGRLLYPFDQMIERHFMRATRRDVTALNLTRPGNELRLERGARGWTVARQSEGGEWSSPVPASWREIEDVLARLEELEVGGFFLDEPAPESSTSVDWPYGVRVEAAGRVAGGRIGGAYEDAEGQAAVLFQRDGDEVVGWIDPWLGELARMRLDQLRSTDLLMLDEVELSGLVLSRGEEKRSYQRDNRGIWREVGVEDEAVELLPLLDPLIFLRASEHLEEPEELIDPISVEFRRFRGDPVSFVVGSGEGELTARIAIGEGVSVAKVGELHERLVGLFTP